MPESSNKISDLMTKMALMGKPEEKTDLYAKVDDAAFSHNLFTQKDAKVATTKQALHSIFDLLVGEKVAIRTVRLMRDKNKDSVSHFNEEEQHKKYSRYIKERLKEFNLTKGQQEILQSTELREALDQLAQHRVNETLNKPVSKS